MKKVLISFISVILAIIAVLTPSVGAFALSESENNDTIQNATPIEVNESVYGRSTNTEYLVGMDADFDYYMFTIPEDGYVDIKFEHDYFEEANYGYIDFSVELLYGDETRIAGMSSNGENETVILADIGLAAGTYYVQIWSLYGYDVLNYKFTVRYTQTEYWETDGNNSMNVADNIEVNQTYYGSMLTDDNDYFKFQIPSDGFISLSFNHDYLDNESYFADIRFFKYNGSEEITLFSYYNNSYSETSESGNFGLSAGTYYLHLREYNCSPSNYNFVLNYTPSDNWEKEINDNHALANTVDIGKTYYGSINKGDKDYFKFTTEKDGYINLKLMHDYLESDDVFAKISMYSYNGTEKNIITSFNSKFSWEGVSSGKEFLEAGTYYFYLDNSETNGEQYSFIVEFFENLPETTTVIETTISEYDYSYDTAETTYSINAEDAESPNSCVGEIIIVVLLIMAFVIAIILKAKNKKKDN